ncbi:MAG: hypothetical protein M1832_003326 [Thelocarpon impressellum]|nr:MAG: hypothetical protein M1832_003326 [Thelocarpon impressellum]
MSKPLPNAYDVTQSPIARQTPGGISSPASPPGGAGPSFKTNVNRQKTKRWVEAKSFSYDGDDWGEVDDFDEYGARDPPAPPKPTGLRQRGQSIGSPRTPSPNSQSGDAPPGSAMPPGHGPSNQHGPFADPARQRSSSFDRGDESALTSSQAPPFPSEYAPGSRNPPTRFPDIEAPRPPEAVNHQRDNSRNASPRGLRQHNPRGSGGHPQLHVQTPSTGVQPPPGDGRAGPGQRDVSQPQPSQGSPFAPAVGSTIRTTPSMEFHERRDFSPSAVPAPLQSRGSPAPQSAGPDAQALQHRPPRKSSLSNASETDATGRDRTGSNPPKPLHFIRPADIYKRMTEEREKERQSLDSSRPSMDSITSGRPTEAQILSSGAGPRPHISSENLGPAVRRVPSLESGIDETDFARRPRQTLDPVAERKSEYGLDGLSTESTAFTFAFAGSPSIVLRVHTEAYI